MGNIKNRLLTHYLALTIFTILTTIVFKLAGSTTNVIAFITDVSGYISIFLLVISLLIGPVNLILRKKNPVSIDFRRDVSIYGGALAVLHSVVGLFVHFRGKPWLYFFQETENALTIRIDNFGVANHTGLIAVILIILLLAISNDYSLRKLKTAKWKNLQRLSYLMFVFAIVHSIYFRDVLPDNGSFYSIYGFVFLIVLIFQVMGITMRMKAIVDK